MKVKIYGCRGSAVFSRDSYYGGNTSCMVLDNGSSMIILDAGSGLIKLDAELRKKFPDYPFNLPFKPNILIGHLHLDHILGLTGFAPIWAEGTGTRIFTCTRDDRPLNEQVFGIFTPPYWPVHMASTAYAECVNISNTFKVDGFTVTPFSANHPDNTLSFHITDGHKSIVYLLDHEMSQQDEPKMLLEHCSNADLVVFDSAYLMKDYHKKCGWGHSTVQDGIKLAEKSHCKRMVFAHYGQEYSDCDLDELKEIVPNDDRFIFAYEGLEIEV
ncbi:MAG: MBL fold metallo-hydrolase [Defluviitaleaceae bacterium]|nr:MBL fold metallo-hydrolase [Defluviitaleaceae bacterium]